jgi:hypothetical protein
MDDLRVRYRLPYQGLDMRVGTDSSVLTQTFVAQSVRREKRKNDGLNVFRGVVNALLISLVFWIALGLAVFGPF